MFRNQAFYEAGEDKLQDELDVVSLIKTIRSFQQVSSIIFTKEQRMLLKFQNKDIMRSTSEDSDDVAYNNVVHSMRSKHPIIKDKFNRRIDQLMSKYESKPLDKVDRQILKGLVAKEHSLNADKFYDDRVVEVSEDNLPDNDIIYKQNEVLSQIEPVINRSLSKPLSSNISSETQDKVTHVSLRKMNTNVLIQEKEQIRLE